MRSAGHGGGNGDDSHDVDAIRRRVVNVVGHALRTPVTTLCGMADALTHATEPELREQLSAAVQRKGRLVERLLDDLLIAAGVTTALPVGEAADVELSDAVWAAWRGLSSDRELFVAGEQGVVARGQPAAVDRALSAILDNAVKYGTGPVTVELRAVPPMAKVAVSSGGGRRPTPVEVELAFELFDRGSTR
ncbi:MAG: sensor histidine kinase [Acidimicrobiia bacterium]